MRIRTVGLVAALVAVVAGGVVASAASLGGVRPSSLTAESAPAVRCTDQLAVTVAVSRKASVDTSGCAGVWVQVAVAGTDGSLLLETAVEADGGIVDLGRLDAGDAATVAATVGGLQIPATLTVDTPSGGSELPPAEGGLPWPPAPPPAGRRMLLEVGTAGTAAAPAQLGDAAGLAETTGDWDGSGDPGRVRDRGQPAVFATRPVDGPATYSGQLTAELYLARQQAGQMTVTVTFVQVAADGARQTVAEDTVDVGNQNQGEPVPTVQVAVPVVMAVPTGGWLELWVAADRAVDVRYGSDADPASVTLPTPG